FYGLLCEQAGGHHYCRVGRIGAGRDRSNNYRPVIDLATGTVCEGDLDCLTRSYIGGWRFVDIVGGQGAVVMELAGWIGRRKGICDGFVIPLRLLVGLIDIGSQGTAEGCFGVSQ